MSCQCHACRLNAQHSPVLYHKQRTDGAGATLQHMLDEHDFDLTKHANVIAIFSGVLRGLSAVHTMGFIHRDVKPENVMVAPDQAQLSGSLKGPTVA